MTTIRQKSVSKLRSICLTYTTDELPHRGPATQVISSTHHPHVSIQSVRHCEQLVNNTK